MDTPNAEPVTNQNAPAFLTGGGELGGRIRAFDWTASPLGAPPGWPQSLKTLVATMLGSGQPMFIAWGPLRTMIYNDGYAVLCGSKHPTCLGRPFSEVWADIIDDAGPIMDAAYSGVATHMEDIQFTMLDRRGYPEEAHFSFSYTPVRVESGEVAGMFCVGSETTDRVFADRRLRENEQQLRRAHDELERRVRERTEELGQSNAALKAELGERRAAEEQIKTLFKQLVTIQEEERRRIARDIHDQLGQQMTALRLNLEAMWLEAGAHPPLAEQVAKAGQLAEELDHSIDVLTWQLRPATLDHLGLPDALGHLVSSWSDRFQVAADYDTVGVAELRLASDAESNLYRLAQEALHNVYKHADASQVRVSLTNRDGRLLLMIADDGRGFDLSKLSPAAAGLGLVNMRERAALAGGEFRLDTSPGRGTTVSVTLRRVP